MSEYMKVPDDTFDTIQMDTGIITDDFDPETGEIGNILGAIDSGGFNFKSNPTYVDFGEDVGNIPANTWQMLRIQAFDATASGTYANVTNAIIKSLEAGSDYGVAENVTDDHHIVPAHALEAGDFTDIYIVGNYSRHNTGTGSTGAYAGFICVHLMHALNRTGVQWQTTKAGKGKFAFEYHAHYDMTSPDEPPFEYFIRKGSAGSSQSAEPAEPAETTEPAEPTNP